MEKKICSNCGAEVNTSAKVCPMCGNPFEEKVEKEVSNMEGSAERARVKEPKRIKFVEKTESKITETKKARTEKKEKEQVSLILILLAPIIVFVGFATFMILSKSEDLSQMQADYISAIVEAIGVAIGLVTMAFGINKKDNIAISIGIVSAVLGIIAIVWFAVL